MISSNFREVDPELTTSVEAHKLQCLRVYGDGYCIVESVRPCLSHDGQALDKNMVLNGVKKETLYHIEYYRKFLSLQSSDPVAEISSYVENGVYETDIGDMILHIIANLLKIRIVVLWYYPLIDEYRLPHQHIVISPIDTVSELPLPISNTIMLAKNEKHYDGLVLKFRVICIYIYNFQIFLVIKFA